MNHCDTGCRTIFPGAWKKAHAWKNLVVVSYLSGALAPLHGCDTFLTNSSGAKLGARF